MTGTIIARHVTRHVSEATPVFPNLWLHMATYSRLCNYAWSHLMIYGEYGGIWLHVGFLTFKLITVTYDNAWQHI